MAFKLKLNTSGADGSHDVAGVIGLTNWEVVTLASLHDFVHSDLHSLLGVGIVFRNLELHTTAPHCVLHISHHAGEQQHSAQRVDGLHVVQKRLAKTIVIVLVSIVRHELRGHIQNLSVLLFHCPSKHDLVNIFVGADLHVRTHNAVAQTCKQVSFHNVRVHACSIIEAADTALHTVDRSSFAQKVVSHGLSSRAGA